MARFVAWIWSLLPNQPDSIGSVTDSLNIKTALRALLRMLRGRLTLSELRLALNLLPKPSLVTHNRHVRSQSSPDQAGEMDNDHRFEICNPSARRPRRSLLLIVEDDAVVAFVLSRMLAETTVRVVLVASVSEARERLVVLKTSGEPVHGLLTDYGLPDGTGRHAIDAYHRLFPEGEVALMSGARDPEVQDWAASNEMPFFRKPLERQQVLDWINDSIANRPRQRRGRPYSAGRSNGAWVGGQS